MNIVEKIDTPVGSYAPDFELPGIDTQVHHLRRYLEKFRAVGVIFISNQCPCVKLYIDRLKQIQTEFSQQGFSLIGMNGSDGNQNPTESFENMQAFASRYDLNFPYLWDSTQDTTRSIGASKTPMAFLIDQDGVVRYKGQIDDNPEDPLSVKKHYLKIAIASVLQGEEVYIPQTPPVGSCLIWRN